MQPMKPDGTDRLLRDIMKAQAVHDIESNMDGLVRLLTADGETPAGSNHETEIQISLKPCPKIRQAVRMLLDTFPEQDPDALLHGCLSEEIMTEIATEWPELLKKVEALSPGPGIETAPDEITLRLTPEGLSRFQSVRTYVELELLGHKIIPWAKLDDAQVLALFVAAKLSWTCERF